MGREPKLLVAVGKKGVGKSYTTKEMMQQYAYANPRRRVLILDVNDEYYDIKAIRIQDVSLFSVHPTIEIRRIRPFLDDGKRMTLDDIASTLFIILETFRNGLLLVEDINKYISDTMPNDLVGAICTNRHIGVDIIMHYQSIGRITSKVWQNLNIIRMHKITDSVKNTSISLRTSMNIYP
jgi:Cdc6-like AAA superfamily ATPase